MLGGAEDVGVTGVRKRQNQKSILIREYLIALMTDHAHPYTCESAMWRLLRNVKISLADEGVVYRGRSNMLHMAIIEVTFWQFTQCADGIPWRCAHNMLAWYVPYPIHPASAWDTISA